MFKIPSYDNTNRLSMNAARAQISSAQTRNGVAAALSGALLVGGAVGLLNGALNAQYVDLASQIGANIPEAAVSIAGGSGLVTHVIQSIRLRKARKSVDFDIAVDDAVQRRTRR